MSKPDTRLKAYVQLERKRRGWNQTDLGKAAGLSKTTIVEFESGRRLGLGNESAIEEALGWRIGSLDLIRSGGEPVPAESSRIPTLDELVRMPADEVWRVIQRVREVKGALAAQQFRQDFLDYLDRRSTPSDRETRS